MGSLAIPPNSRRAYALAVALLVLALAAQWSLRPLVGHQLPFLFLLPAIGIAAMWGGWRPALIVLAGGVVNGVFWLRTPEGYAFGGAAALVALAGYGVAGGLLLAMGGRISELRARAADAEATLNAKVGDLQALLAERDEAVGRAASSSRRLEVALDTSVVPFCLLQPVRDEAGAIRAFRWDYLNAAASAMLRRPLAELAGKTVRETLVEGTQLDPDLMAHMLNALRSHSPIRFETWFRADTGKRWLDVIASPHEGGLAVWFSDITVRRQQEEALREADRRKDEFLATLAHELRNPLAPIRQAALIARAPAATEEKKRWSYSVIERQVGHMAMLLDDLLDVSRITRGKLVLRKAPTVLAEAVDAALESARPLVEARRQHLETRLGPEPLYLDADRLRLAQVLSNLLTNAAKYTPEGGHIRLAARQENDWAVIEVSDDGAGIAPESLEAIFEMFTQVRGPDNTRAGGLGIGLALSRGLVELHGGRLEVRSAGLGQGSTFSVRLPCPAAVEAPPVPDVDLPVASRARRILVADDNRDAALSLADLLRMEGHEVTVAFDGEDALQQFGAFVPDVALLDIGMPKMTGNEVASAIRGRPDGLATLLVAITGWGQERDRHAAREAGFDHHFTKPVDPARVLQLLAEAEPPGESTAA